MKTNRVRTALAISLLTLAALPLTACSKRADASTQGAPAGTEDPAAAQASDAPKEGRGRRHGGRVGRGDRVDGKRFQRLREILRSAGVSREQTQTVFQRLRAERARGGPVRAEQVLADVLPSLSPEQREEALKIVRGEGAAAPTDD